MTWRTTWPPAPTSMRTWLARPARGLLLGADDEAGSPGRRGPPIDRPSRGARACGSRPRRWPRGRPATSRWGTPWPRSTPRWAVLSATAVAGQEERVRRFARVFLALPASAATGPPPDRQPFGVAARTHRAGSSTFLALANDTPYPIRLETVLTAPPSATVDDLGRGLRLVPEVVAGRSHVVLDLPPFGVAAIRVGAPEGRARIGDPLSFRGGHRRHEGAIRRALRPARPAERPSRPGRGRGPAQPGIRAGPVARGRAGRLAGLPRPPAAGRSPATRPTPSRSTCSIRIPAAPASGWTPGSPRVRRRRSLHPERPVEPDGPGLAPRRPSRRQGPGLDRGGGGGSALRPALRAVGGARLGRDGRPRRRAAGRGARQRPAPVRDDDGRQPLDRRPGHRGRDAVGARAAQRRATPCWRPCTPTARSVSPTSPGWPARTGPGTPGPATAGRGGPAESAGMLRTGDSTPLPPGRRLR